MFDVTDECTFKLKAAALGCYYQEVWHQGSKIGTAGYNGVHVFDDNYEAKETPIDDMQSRICWFQKERIEPQVPLE
jgi:hypothetical protein